MLADGTLRFSELRSRIGRIAPKVLTQTLRAMEVDGLVTRQVFAEVPPRTEYTLTELGHSLIEPLAAALHRSRAGAGPGTRGGPVRH
jgi:DNA-binding HxlR family transcriptional regulator